MLTASAELHSIWNQAKIDWQNFATYAAMVRYGYTQTHHQRFVTMMAEGIPSEPGHLDQVLLPLKVFYVAKARQLETDIAEASQNAETATAKISPLFKGLKNNALENLKKSYDTKDDQGALKNSITIVRLIDFVLADPRLKQIDPALVGHSLDY